MKKNLLLIIITMSITTSAQQILSPEALWKLGRVSAIGISKDGKSIVYKVATPSVEENKSNSKFYTIPVTGGNAVEIQENDTKDLVVDKNISPDGKYILSSQEVKTENVLGKDFYPELEKSEAQIYDGLDYRHWDTWNNGTHNHVFYAINKGSKATPIDIMKGEPYDSPQKPFGGDEDYIWSPNSKSIIYVCKKKFGTAYAISTNTDLYEFDIETKTTKNLTENNPGYDTNPAFSPNGDLTWLQMKRDGYEADKNDIIVKDGDFIEFGNSKLKVLHTPGHSNDSICLVGDGNIFSGDTLFVGNCGRIDLPGGSASKLYHSLFDNKARRLLCFENGKVNDQPLLLSLVRCHRYNT